MPEILKSIALTTILILVILMTCTVFTTILLAKVPYVPTKKKAIKKILDNVKLNDNDVVYDLGCGDGRFLMEAEKKYGVLGIGYELAIIPYLLALIKKHFFKLKMKIHLKNFFQTDLKDANIIFCYLYPELMDKVSKKIEKECQKGTRVISNTFQIKNKTPFQVLDNIYIYKF